MNSDELVTVGAVALVVYALAIAWRKRAADLAQTAASSALLDKQYREGWGYGD
jgi:hypothetical protein